MVQSILAEIMDNYTPERQSAQKINDYMVDVYVCQQSACSSVGIWNVYRNMRDTLPCTNNGVEEHNFRMFILFPYHSILMLSLVI